LEEDKVADGGAGAEGARAPSDFPSITVLGVGNTLMGDDGFGVFVVEGLEASVLGPNIKVVSGDTAGMALLKHFLESDAVIVIDAVAAEAEPGAIFRFDPDEAGVLNLRTNNIHGMGVPHLITTARLKGAAPEVVVLAVQVASVVPRDRELSPPVAAAVGRVQELVADEVARIHDRWHATPAH